MAPRLKGGQLSTIFLAPKSSGNSICATCSRCQRRLFAISPINATRRRRDMFYWLTGPGSVFRDPLPGSTNYLNAYDNYGNLMRAPNMPIPGRQNDKSKQTTEPDLGSAEEDEGNPDAEKEGVSEDGPPKRKKSEKLLQEQEKAAARRPGLPKETQEDLMPFPMNRSFRSQAVLSEELKDEIYRRITEGNKSVRDVSAALGVEMRRVGAVVRLKALEKRWEEEVSSLAPILCSSEHEGCRKHRMMSQTTISLEDIQSWLQRINYNSLKRFAI